MAAKGKPPIPSKRLPILIIRVYPFAFVELDFSLRQHENFAHIPLLCGWEQTAFGLPQFRTSCQGRYDPRKPTTHHSFEAWQVPCLNRAVFPGGYARLKYWGKVNGDKKSVSLFHNEPTRILCKLRIFFDIPGIRGCNINSLHRQIPFSVLFWCYCLHHGSCGIHCRLCSIDSTHHIGSGTGIQSKGTGDSWHFTCGKHKTESKQTVIL